MMEITDRSAGRIRRFAGMVSAVAPLPVRHFPSEEADAAMRWLRTQ